MADPDIEHLIQELRKAGCLFILNLKTLSREDTRNLIQHQFPHIDIGLLIAVEIGICCKESEPDFIKNIPERK